jgi:hypothetical protein
MSPGNDEGRPASRPHVNVAPSSAKSPVPSKDDTSDRRDARWRRGVACVDTDEPASLPTQIRRRRAASYRLPALVDGRRDPLQPPVMPGGRHDAVGAERAWRHLCDAGLQSELVERVLRGAA